MSSSDAAGDGGWSQVKSKRRNRRSDEEGDAQSEKKMEEDGELNIRGLNIGNPPSSSVIGKGPTPPGQGLTWVKGGSITLLKEKLKVYQAQEDKVKEERARQLAEAGAAKAEARRKELEEALAAKERREQADKNFSLEFGGFLKTFKNNSGEFQYPAQIDTMKRLKSYVLHVDFMDILSDEKYKYLAIRLGESTEYGWLHWVIAEFLIENGMDNEDINELLLKVSLSFTNMHSLMALKAHMQSKPCWKTTKNDEKTLTAHGRISFWLLISDVLNKNTENISYNGKFKEDDILMGEKFRWIYSKQLQNQPNMSYLADLSSTWTVMQSYYEIHLGSETYPQNLNELMDSLQLIGFHPSVVRNPAYIAFMRYHPSIASSIAKRTLTTELRRAVRDQDLENEHFLSRVPIGAWQQWEKKYSRNEWAEPFRESISPVLKGVYWYDPSFATSTSKGQQGPAKTTGKGQLTSISKGPSQVKISPKGVATSSQEEKEKFPNTVWGMFDYKRCVIEHGMEHAEGQFVYESASSVEIHVSGPFSGLLAYLLYTMLKNQLFRKGSRLRFIFKT